MHKGEEGTCGKWSEWGRISVCGVVQAYRKLLGFDSTRKQRRDPFVNPGSPAVAFTPGALRPCGKCSGPPESLIPSVLVISGQRKDAQ